MVNDQPNESMRHIRDWNWIRILGPGYDSGWRSTGNNPHDAAKHHVRKWCRGAEDHYFIAKRDHARADWRGPETGIPLAGMDVPVAIWHRQAPWQVDFDMPADLWSGIHNNGIG